MPESAATPESESVTRGGGLFERLAGWCVHHRVVVLFLALMLVLAGAVVAPFRGTDAGMGRAPISVDALPDITDNQQIVFTRWPGRSPEDVSDQVTYPLSVALLGTPGVESIRTTSMFGFASINVIFEDSVDFYWARSRVLEKLSSLPEGSLPEGVVPNLGPEASGLGQIFWYTLEARDEQGKVVGGAFALDELRSVQDFTVRYALQGVPGVAEVASVGGYVREYQVEVDRDALRVHGVTLHDVVSAVRAANRDVGARTMEINGVEYVIRGLGRVRSVEDLESAVLGAHEEHTPIRIRDVARVQLGPALRRGALDDSGAETVGGVVTARYGANPMEVVERVRERIEAISPGLPSRVLADGTTARIHLVPFYDRAELIDETLGTLTEALHHELLITVLVVLLLLGNLKSASLVSMVLPLSVAGTLVMMKLLDVGANVMALSGIAIAIGTMVDVAIVFTENITEHLRSPEGRRDRTRAIARAVGEVAPAVWTAMATTILSFLPIFGLTGQEGRMFGPLAITKTLALAAAGVVSLAFLPAAAAWLSGSRTGADAGRTPRSRLGRWVGVNRFELLMLVVAVVGGLSMGVRSAYGWVVVAGLRMWANATRGAAHRERWLGLTYEPSPRGALRIAANVVALVLVVAALSQAWGPLGMSSGLGLQMGFVGALMAALVVSFGAFQRGYDRLLGSALRHRFVFLSLNAGLVALGAAAWLGASSLFAHAPTAIRDSALARDLDAAFPGLPEDFIPPFDEGSFLYMPSTTSNASLGQSLELLQRSDMAIAAIPEVRRAVGKIGRAETPLDPAPVSMIETIVELEPEYQLDEDGDVARFAFDVTRGTFERDGQGALIPDPDGRPFRRWRPEVRDMDDVWDAIVEASRIPGLSGVSRLQPIETRILMLQTGMRAQAGIKVFGPDLRSIERFSRALETIVRDAPEVDARTVLVDRVVGKPYLEIEVDRDALGRHGLSISRVQETVEAAIGGQAPTATIEGRERYEVRVRYPREDRDNVQAIGEILVSGHRGEQVPLRQLADIRYARGPQMIRSEDTFLVGYVTFEPAQGWTAVDAVTALNRRIDGAIAAGTLPVPEGVSHRFSGAFEGQLRSTARLMLLVPIALATIFMLLYLQFRRVATTLIVFSGVLLAGAGGMLMVWAWGHPAVVEWVEAAGWAKVLPVGPVPVTVTVWVGFLVLFGVATDNGVILASQLDRRFQDAGAPGTAATRDMLIEAARRRVRPCLMATGTTMLALLPIVTSTGRGADLMIPMALPLLGGVAMSLLTLLTVPVLYGLLVVPKEGTDRVGTLAEDDAGGAGAV